MRTLKAIRYWNLELFLEESKACTTWEVHVKGEARPHESRADQEDKILFLSAGTSPAQALRSVAEMIDAIETQRRTGEGILQPPVIPPFQADPEGNTDGDVKADKLTGGAE